MTTMSTTTAPMFSGKPPMSRRRVATVGILFVVQMVTAMFGTFSIQAFVDGDTDRTPMTVGVLLMTCSGLALIGIGLLMYPVPKDVHPAFNAVHGVLRCLGERANSLLKTTYQALSRYRCCPWRLGRIGAAALVLLHIEHQRTT